MQVTYHRKNYLPPTGLPLLLFVLDYKHNMTMKLLKGNCHPSQWDSTNEIISAKPLKALNYSMIQFSPKFNV